MRLSIWLITVSSLLSGCATLPEKPKGDLCTLYLQNTLDDSLGICSPLKQAQSANDLHYSRVVEILRQSNATHDVPLRQMNKAVAFSPETWEGIANYVDKLEEIAKRKCE